ncbi:MAG: SDR family oxidoreductase [Candidatus Thorarchaeota archaeon]
MKDTMKGKICLVTGGTSGIGLETAGGLAELGATVIITGRNEDLGKQVVEKIKQKTGNGYIELIIADFAKQSEVHRLANEIKNRYDRLDVLVNNAGLYQHEYALTNDGIETTYAVNYLAPFLLTNLLIDLLRKGAPSRIINVSSSWHKNGKINFEDINYTKNYNGMQAYMNTKLALIMHTYLLSRKLEDQGITVNTVHPGIVKTNLPRQKSFFAFLLRILPFISAKKGAETSIYLASSPEVEHISGKYFTKKRPAETLAISYDESLQQKLWKLSVELTKLDGNSI